jgi:hypothetical protein
VDPNIVALLALVWYWVSGTMAVFGGRFLSPLLIRHYAHPTNENVET